MRLAGRAVLIRWHRAVFRVLVAYHAVLWEHAFAEAELPWRAVLRADSRVGVPAIGILAERPVALFLRQPLFLRQLRELGTSGEIPEPLMPFGRLSLDTPRRRGLLGDDANVLELGVKRAATLKGFLRTA